MDNQKELWIVANWKSNKTLQEAIEWVEFVGPKIERRENIKVVVCPQFTQLEEVKKAIMVSGYPLLVGAQDLSPFEEGPFTGEESAKDLVQFVSLVILGHSERRKNFGETDEMVAEKVKQAIEVGITPLVCIQQTNTPIPKECKMIAYEPIYAISTSGPDARPETPQNAQEVAKKVKESFPEALVLYGGSVDESNVKAFIQQENINGVLVGGASLDSEKFLKLTEACY